MHTQAQKAPVDVLHIVNIGYSASGMASYINVSRRLVRWMKQIQLPRTALRMRYVRLIHAYHVLDGSCSHNALIDAMCTLLAGWVSVDEGDADSSYCRHLREVVAYLQGQVKNGWCL